MGQDPIIIVTGAAGFIGSYMVGYLNKKGHEKLILADEFDDDEKEWNLHEKKYLVRVERDNLFEWLGLEQPAVDLVFHLGARTDTREFNYSVHENLNVEYSKKIWEYCTRRNVPLIYASSAATYGSGEWGFKDDHSVVAQLKPLNPYGVSKNEFDKWALRQSGPPPGHGTAPPFWAGLKFFNVYGANEYHKGGMASVVFHSFNQIRKTGKVKLFRSHNPKYRDGEQLRDFIYAEDVMKIMHWMMDTMDSEQWALEGNGIYNAGTGKARTFKDLASAIFASMNLKPEIEYIDIPEDIRDKYQYFTEADMNKLRKAGYKESFFSLEQGVADYVKNFLLPHEYF